MSGELRALKEFEWEVSNARSLVVAAEAGAGTASEETAREQKDD